MNDKLEEYISAHCSPVSEVLAELYRQTNLQILMPQMLSGKVQGRLLEFISRMIQPHHILEIGTYTGYSAICLAAGLKENGKLITIEIDDELEDFAMSFFKKAGFEKQIEMKIGDALALLPNINEQFDLIFIDGHKQQYSNYYNLVFEKLKSGGFLIADNVLWYSKVIDCNSFNDPCTAAIIEFNRMIQNDNRVENVLLPIRDGLMLIRKK